MTKTLKRAAAIAAWLAVVAFLLGVLFRVPLERAAATSLLGSATGLTVELDDVQNEPGGIVVLGARAHSQDSALALLVPRLELKRSGGNLTVDVDRPQVNATATSWNAPVQQALAFAHRFGIGDERILVRVHRGVLQLAGESAVQSAPQWNLGFGSIEGSIQRVAGVTTFDLTGAFVDGLTAYPLALRSDVAGDVVTDRWSAAQLPLAPLSAPLPSGTLRFTAGTLNDVALAYPRGAGGTGIAIQGGAHVSGVAATLTGDRTHQLSDLHGALMFAGEGLATPRIAGQIDGVPFDMVAEVHGLDGAGRWLTTGNRDLQQLAQLLNGMADQPELTSVHLETTAPGIAFGQYGMTTEHGPLAVQLLAIDPREPTLHFDTALSNDRIVSGGERTSAMGLRTGAVGGVNGDYFDIGRTYQPQGLLIKNGELLRGPTDRMALLVHRDGSVTFGEFRMRGTMHTLRGDFPVTQLNNWPAGDVTVITPAFGKTLPPAPGVTFAALVPLGSAGTYRVESVTPMTEPVPVRFGLAFGQLAHAELHPGEEVDLQFALDPPAGDVVAGIGGGPLLLRDGEWYEDPHAPAPDERDVRWPVVALAKLTDGSLLLVAVDGRHPERSVGMTRPEFADLLHDFGAQDAMALDSGGSVTMVSRAPGDTKVTVRNVPSDNSAERWVSDGLFVYSSAPQPALLTHSAVATVAQPTPSPSPSPSP